MIEIISNPDIGHWREFVSRHPHGNIFQTPEMAEVFSSTKNYTPLVLAAIDKPSGEILSLMNSVTINEFNRLFKSMTSRSIVTGGPLYHDSDKSRESVRLLIKRYDALCRKQALYSEIRNLWEMENPGFPKEYVYEEHLNFIVDVSVGIEKMWERISKARRYGITRSKKMGVRIEEIKSDAELDSLYYLLTDTYKKVRIPLADKSLFNSLYLYLIPEKMSKIFFAWVEDTPVGAIVLLLYKQKMYDWYACSLKEYSKWYPGDLLVWYSLEWGARNNFSSFDFMGAGKPGEKYGVREFKRQFGGELVNFGRYNKIHSPVKYWIAQRGLTAYKKVGTYVRLRH